MQTALSYTTWGMKITRACLILLLTSIACGTLSSFADFDADLSSMKVDSAVAPADGNTQVMITLNLRYSKSVPAKGVPVTLEVTGVPVALRASSGATDANGDFKTTMTGQVPGVARLAATIRGQSGNTALVSSVQFVSIASGASLALGSQATVGVSETAVVTILDNTGQRVLYYTGTVAFTSSDPLAVLPPVYQFTSADQGQHTFEGVTFETAGTQSLRVSDMGNANITASVSAIDVSVKTAPMLEVSGISAALAGATNQVRVRAVNIYSQTLTDYTGTVHFSSSDPRAQLPADATFSATDAGVKSLPVTLKTAGFQSVSAVDVNNILISGIQPGIWVALQADRFALTLNTPVAAGVSAQVHVAASDAYGNVDPNYLGLATLTSSDTRAVLPAPYRFTARDVGMHDASVTFLTGGDQTLTAQDATANLLGETRLQVAGADAQRLTLLGPAQAVAGSIINLVATAYDSFGNVSDGYVANLVATSSDSNATLPGSLAVTAEGAGMVVLTPVTLTTAGLQNVTVVDVNRSLSATAQVQVLPASASSVSLAGVVASSAGTTQSVAVSVFDAYHNLDTHYVGTLQFTSDDPQAVLPPATTFAITDAGTRILSPVLFKTEGRHTLNVADVAHSAVRGAISNILIAPLSASRLVVLAPGQAAVAQMQNVSVQALDTFGNIDPNYAGTVTLSSSDVSATLPGAYTFASADAGQVRLPVTLATAGLQSLMATSDAALRSPIVSINVVASVASKLGLTGLSSGSAGRTQHLVIQALDDFNNLVSGYTGTLQLSSSDANANIPNIVTLSAADGGQKLVSIMLLTAGVQSVRAQDVAAPGMVGQQQNLLISAVADRLRVACPSVITAGVAFALSVAGIDAYGNVDTSYTGTVTLSTTSAAASLPTSLSIPAGGSGLVISPNAMLLGAGTQLSITAQDTLRPLSGTRTGLQVVAGAAAHFSVQAPLAAFVGVPFTATVIAFDAYGNQAVGYTGAAVLSSSDTAASMVPTLVFNTAAQGSVTADHQMWGTADSSASLTATDLTQPSLSGTLTGILVRAGGAAKLRLVGASSGVAGHTDTVTVNATDSNNNLATNYTGTVRFASSDSQAILPASYTFTGADAGSRTFTVQWHTAGLQSLSVSDSATSTLTANQNGLLITAGAAQALRLLDISSAPIVAGVSRSVGIAAIDAYGNIDPNYTGTLAFRSLDALATLPGAVVFGASNVGTVTTAVTFRTAGAQSLSANDMSVPPLNGTLANENVAPAATAALTLDGIANALAGTSNAATVYAIDAFGNRVTAYSGTVHFSSSDPLAVLSGDVTFRVQDQGSRNVPLTLFTGGSQSVSATDTANPNIAGTQLGVLVRVARSHLSVTPPPPGRRYAAIYHQCCGHRQLR